MAVGRKPEWSLSPSISWMPGHVPNVLDWAVRGGGLSLACLPPLMNRRRRHWNLLRPVYVTRDVTPTSHFNSSDSSITILLTIEQTTAVQGSQCPVSQLANDCHNCHDCVLFAVFRPCWIELTPRSLSVTVGHRFQWFALVSSEFHPAINEAKMPPPPPPPASRARPCCQNNSSVQLLLSTNSMNSFNSVEFCSSTAADFIDFIGQTWLRMLSRKNIWKRSMCLWCYYLWSYLV